jgi:hypothetical protein
VRRMGLMQVPEQVVYEVRERFRSNHRVLSEAARSCGRGGRSGGLHDPPMVQ